MGRVVHFEISADDLDRAKKFYAEALGWEIKDAGMPGSEYWLAATGRPEETGIGGAIMPREYRKQAVVNTVSVDDIDVSMGKVKAAGGTISDEVHTIPGVGKHVYVTDTEGNLFALLQPDPAMTQG